MLERIVSGVIGLLIIVPAMVWGGELAAEIIIGVAMIIGVDELTRMALPERHKSAFVSLSLVSLGVYVQLLWGPQNLNLGVLAMGALWLMLHALFVERETGKAADTAMRLLGGLIYLPVLFSFIAQVRRFESGLTWVFLLLAVTWLGDTGAYFAGRAFGKTKLFERVSPKKTWEGAVGGFFAAIGAACAVKAIGLPNLPWGHAIALGAILDVAGVVGDLVESMLKRSYNVKDSGWVMPGHGGILDRVDSLLFSAPVAWVYATLFGLG